MQSHCSLASTEIADLEKHEIMKNRFEKIYVIQIPIDCGPQLCHDIHLTEIYIYKGRYFTSNLTIV